MSGGIDPLCIRARVPLAGLDPSNRLLADFQAGGAATHDLLPALPDTAPALNADRRQLAEILTAYQQRLQADPPALENARRLADPSTLVVCVGQQPGLLTGPLYTPLKALTAISLAQRLARMWDRPVAPVFWVGADDDDRAEIDHCAWWDRHRRLYPIRYPADAGVAGQMVGDLPSGVAGTAVLEQVQPLFEGAPYAEAIMALLRETLAQSEDLGHWCSLLLSRLCSRFGLVLCDPRLPELRALAAPVLQRELAAPLRSTAQVNAMAAELRRRGFHPQLTKPADQCNLFLLDGQRRRITFADGRFHVEQQSYMPDELVDMLARAPERFIPNAVLRPVVQEYLFNSAAVVVGPNELCYWAELGPVFRGLGVSMPPVIPRAGVTLAPQTIARQLAAWKLAPTDLYPDFDVARRRMQVSLAPPAVAAAFAQARQTVSGLMTSLGQQAAEVDATLAQSAVSGQQRMLNEIDRLEHKTHKAIERQAGEQMARLGAIEEVLFPQHGLQERALNLCAVLAQEGPALLDRLLAAIDQQEGQHLFVELA